MYQLFTNGTIYYFVVKALNGVGESGDSNEDSAAPDENISLRARDWRLCR